MTKELNEIMEKIKKKLPGTMIVFENRLTTYSSSETSETWKYYFDGPIRLFEFNWSDGVKTEEKFLEELKRRFRIND